MTKGNVFLASLAAIGLSTKGIRNLVWVLAPWVFVAITFKEWILVLDG